MPDGLGDPLFAFFDPGPAVKQLGMQQQSPRGLFRNGVGHNRNILSEQMS
jgi:hypothetical protein